MRKHKDSLDKMTCASQLHTGTAESLNNTSTQYSRVTYNGACPASVSSHQTLLDCLTPLHSPALDSSLQLSILRVMPAQRKGMPGQPCSPIKGSPSRCAACWQ